LNITKMRAVVLLTTIFMALAAAAPEKTMEKLRERELCVSAPNLTRL
jgi:hypothetical protein